MRTSNRSLVRELVVLRGTIRRERRHKVRLARAGLRQPVEVRFGVIRDRYGADGPSSHVRYALKAEAIMPTRVFGAVGDQVLHPQLNMLPSVIVTSLAGVVVYLVCCCCREFEYRQGLTSRRGPMHSA
jgi:hypothetical protein